jgi:hypothetical protein
MPITTSQEIWAVIEERLPRDQWVPLPLIYELIEQNIALHPDDFLPEAPGAQIPRWKRNVRNVLQRRKSLGDIAWDRDGKYMIQTGEIAILEDGVRTVAGKTRPHALSAEGFRRLQQAREEIGELGEQWVVEHEIRALHDAGRDDLAGRVQRVSIRNVAAGYDVLSFDTDGNEKYIEVKTTVLTTNVFQITANEIETAEKYGDRFWLYFVSEIRGNPQLIAIQNPARHIGSMIRLTPMTYQAEIENRTRRKGVKANM